MDEQIIEAFPSLTNSTDEKERYSKLKNRILIQLDYIIGESDERKKLKAIDDYFYELSKPKIYWGSDGAEMQFDKDYETNCITISQHLGSMSPKEMTTFEFLNTIEQLKKQFEKNIK